MGWIAAFCAGALVMGVMVMSMPRQRDVRVIVGKYREMPPMPTPTPAPIPSTPTPAPVTPQPKPQPTQRPVPQTTPRHVMGPTGTGPGPARVYQGVFVAPKDLLFFLVIGSDARPYQDMTKARADSIHIVAVDPKAREGTILGIPRDSYVNIPGHGKRKINAALPLGGPNLLVKTVRELTKMPISHYALTGFEGIDKITDTLHGVDVYVPYDMDDDYSGARFKKGWHHMNGVDALAFNRARHGVPGGDFGRSKNHGHFILHALKKMRAETKTKEDLKAWLDVLYRHAKLDMSMKEAVELSVLARNLAPADLVNVVAPGKSQMVGNQSVVMLGEAARALFNDVAADAVADGDLKRNPARPMPGATPKPTPTPTPNPLPSVLPTALPTAPPPGP
jgi:LCP family protein required for cell wall assembly